MPNTFYVFIAISLALIKPSYAALTEAEQQLFLRLHNDVRRAVQPTASNMAALRWNPAIAQIAQAYAERCEFVNNPSHAYGENIAWGAYGNDITRVVQSWADPTSYTYSTDSCIPGKQCSSYVVIVSASSTNLGCGMHTCGTNEIYVCNYDPSGTQAGVQPYKQGPLASECQVGYSGANGLCVSAASSNQTTPMQTNSPMLNSLAPVNGTMSLPVTDEPAEIRLLPGAGAIPKERSTSSDQAFPNSAKSTFVRGIEFIQIAMISLFVAAVYM